MLFPYSNCVFLTQVTRIQNLMCLLALTFISLVMFTINVYYWCGETDSQYCMGIVSHAFHPAWFMGTSFHCLYNHSLRWLYLMWNGSRRKNKEWTVSWLILNGDLTKSQRYHHDHKKHGQLNSDRYVNILPPSLYFHAIGHAQVPVTSQELLW